MILQSGHCACPEGHELSSQMGVCLDVVSTHGRSVFIYNNIEAKSHRRHLQTTQTTPIVVSGQNLVVSNTDFVSTDGTFNTAYMVTVDAATFTNGLQITFTNCTFTITGHFFSSSRPVNLLFDGCTFNVANTTNLVNVDYTGSCDKTTQDGSITFKNSLFRDQTTQATTVAAPKYLINAKSNFDFIMNGLTFSGMKNQHQILLDDYQCPQATTKIQTVTVNNIRMTDANPSFLFQYDSLYNVANQLQFQMTNSYFNKLNLTQSLFQVTMTSTSPAGLTFNNLTFEDLTLSTNVLQLYMNQSAVTLQQIVVNKSMGSEIIRIDKADSVTTASLIQLESVRTGTTVDANKALISISNTRSVTLDRLVLNNSAVTTSPAIIIDTVTSLAMRDAIINNISLQSTDMISIRKPGSVSILRNTVSLVKQTPDGVKNVFSFSSLVLTQGVSTYLIQDIVFRDSQSQLFSVKSLQSQAADTSKYMFSIKSCLFSNNIFSAFDLFSFTDIPTARFDLDNVGCIPTSVIPNCTVGTYFDTILEACTACPTGCQTCSAENKCLTCSVANMAVDATSGLCQCPFQQYFYQVGIPMCRQCLLKCATCNNEFKCLTYQQCPNQYQTLANGQCSFKCQTGYPVNSQTCGSCSDTNCQICDRQGGVERCALCQNGFYLDLNTYQCVSQCPFASKAITSNNTQSRSGQFVNYCRPFANAKSFNYEYYVDPSSTSQIELGTVDYPFKNMDTPVKEVFNFMTEKETEFTVYHRRGTSMKHYYGIMPIILVNMKRYTLKSYGNFSLPKPYVYITGHEYLWPDSTLFSLAETYYDLNKKVARGDMDVSEATKFFLKFNVFRSNLEIVDIDFQSIMFGDAWSNPLIFTFDAPNCTVVIDNAYLDLDGAMVEGYSPISLRLSNSLVNVTNYQYGVWNDFRWDCYANNATTLHAYLIVENSRFIGRHQQALYNFFYFASFDDFIMRNNTFDGCTYLDMETRPFLDVHPQSMCDPDFRTQKVFLDSNKFFNLMNSNLLFTVNYMYAFNGTKLFSMQNNTIQNSTVNTQLISFQIQQPSSLIVANNFYRNMTVLKDKKVFYFFSERSNLTIQNETLVNNTLDDLYTVGAASNIVVQNFLVRDNINTGSITETSAILRISTAGNLCQIRNFTVVNSTFMYGKAIEIESARILDFRDATYMNNRLQNQDFFVFNQIVRSTIQNLQFLNFTKQSDKSRFAISMPTLTLVQSVTQHDIMNINFTESQASFLSVSQVQISTQGDTQFYNFNITNCTVANNSLSSKDSLIEFGEINYKNFSVNLTNVNIRNNSLELGTIYSLKMNCRQMLIQNSQILNNSGQFASLEPASSDANNSLNFFLLNTMFYNNYAKADALIQLTTNSILRANNSNFLENYSIGRGSIVFADYQAVKAFFNNCTFTRNYAYQGGAFYIQYSSEAELSNCTITENFAVTGGVAYVNNDGRIKMNSQTRVFKNSALNTCFLFLINTQNETLIDNITVTQNDQANALIDKNQFQSINTSYKHIKLNFFQAMQVISDKVLRTIKEKADSAVYAIKAKVNFNNTDIFQNDLLLAASTESFVNITNSTIRDIVSTGKIFQAVSSQIDLRSVTISNVTYTKAASDPNFYKISVVNKSTFRATNCTLSSIMGLLLYVSGSSLFIDYRTRFINTTNDDRDSSLIAIDTSFVNITDSIFHNLSSLYFSPIITLQDNLITVNHSSFRIFDKTLFQLEGGNYYYTNVTIAQGGMKWMPNERSFKVNSIVFDASFANLYLLNSNISGIFTNYSSPVVYIENDAAATSSIILNMTNSTFANNVATENAGVVYALNTDVFINMSRFENNTAQFFDGGALYLDCQDAATFQCYYNISNSIFRNNTASINGGAIKYTYYRPNITNNNTFVNNQAIYGQIMSSYAYQMYFKDMTAPKQRMLQGATNSTPPALPPNITLSLSTPLVSGSLITQNVSIFLVDDQNRTMITDNSSLAIMTAVSSNLQVMKSKSVRANQGMYIFDDVIIIGPPGTDIMLKITSDSINANKIKKAFPELPQTPEMYIMGKLRLCIRGEYQTSDNKCIVCSDGFFTLSENQKQCSECPENSICTMGWNISVDQGYWRKDINSIAIYQCYNPKACLGGYEVQCAPGYGGNLCQSCVKYNDRHYSRESANNCQECIQYSTNSWRLAGVTILVVVYFIILIFINIRTAGQQKITTVYMRILTNYFQILTLASSYDLSWNDNMKKFLEAISFIAQSSDIILSVDCFLKDNGITTPPHYIKMILACLLPLIFIAAVTIFWSIFYLVRRKSQVVSNLIMSIIILIFITLPPVTTITFAIYNCIDIFNNGSSYLALDMSLQCWSGDHNKYAKGFGIPIILIWIVGIPLLALFILFRRRHKLGEEDNLTRYGFLYVGLNHNAFYWEILLHFRKVLMISINVFFTTFKPLYRALIGFMLMIIYIEILQKVQPYQNTEINDLEFKANIAAFATFYGGLFFISDDLPLGVTILLFILILMINIIFWLSWVKMIFNSYYVKAKNVLMRIFCKVRYAKAQALQAQTENQNDKIDFLDDEKKKAGDHEAGPDNGYDESHRYALANNQSHRVDDSARQDPSALIISGYNQKGKEVTRSKKPKKEKKGKQSSSDTPQGSNSFQSSDKTKTKQEPQKKVKQIDSYSDETISENDHSDYEKDQKKKKKSQVKKKKKDSTSDFESSNNKKEGSATSGDHKANAGELIDDITSAENEKTKSKQSKEERRKARENQQQKAYQQVADDSILAEDREFSISHVQPYTNVNSTKEKLKKVEKEGRQQQDAARKSPKNKVKNRLSISSDSGIDGEMGGPQGHRSRSKSNKRKDVETDNKQAALAMRAFRSPSHMAQQQKEQQFKQTDSFVEEQALAHTIKSKRKKSNQKQDPNPSAMEGDRLFQRKKKPQLDAGEVRPIQNVNNQQKNNKLSDNSLEESDAMEQQNQQKNQKKTQNYNYAYGNRKQEQDRGDKKTSKSRSKSRRRGDSDLDDEEQQRPNNIIDQDSSDIPIDPKKKASAKPKQKKSPAKKAIPRNVADDTSEISEYVPQTKKHQNKAKEEERPKSKDKRVNQISDYEDEESEEQPPQRKRAGSSKKRNRKGSDSDEEEVDLEAKRQTRKTKGANEKNSRKNNGDGNQSKSKSRSRVKEIDSDTQ